MGDPVKPVDPVAAKAAGYTPAEIAAENTRRGVTAAPVPVDSAVAVGHGYTPAEIAAENARRGIPAPAAAPEPAVPPQGNSAIGSAPIAFADQAINALSFGQAPRIAAGVQSLLGNGKYSDLEQQYRASLAEDKRDHSAASIGGTVAGAVLNPLNAALAGLGMVRGGAVAGALQGSGDAPDDLKSQAMGVGAGAAGGAALGGILGRVSKVFGPSSSELAQRAITQDPSFAANLAQHVNAGRGSDVMAANLTPQAEQEAMNAAKASPEAHAALEAGQATQMHSDPAHAAFSAAARGPEGYGGLEAANASLPVDKFKEIASPDPQMVAIQRKAMKPGDIQTGQHVLGLYSDQPEAVGPKSAYQMMVETGVNEAKAAAADPVGAQQAAGGPGRPLTFNDVQNYKMALDAHAKSAFAGSATGELGTVYNAESDKVRQYLVDHAPGYQKVDAAFAQGKENQRVMQTAADRLKIPMYAPPVAPGWSLDPTESVLGGAGGASLLMGHPGYAAASLGLGVAKRAIAGVRASAAQRTAGETGVAMSAKGEAAIRALMARNAALNLKGPVPAAVAPALSNMAASLWPPPPR